MTSREHSAMAEKLVDETTARHNCTSPAYLPGDVIEFKPDLLPLAQVHATLAVAAANREANDLGRTMHQRNLERDVIADILHHAWMARFGPAVEAETPTDG